jgi:pentatricopeptide repeat protein
MPRTRMVIDGLWRCLCPSVDSIAFSRTLKFPSFRSLCAPKPTRFVPQSCDALRRYERREYHGTASAYEQHNAETESSRLPRDHKWPERTRDPVKVLLECEPPYRELANAPVPIIYDALRKLRNSKDSFRRVAAFVGHLVREREAPSLFLYEILVHVMVDTRCSARALLKLIAEMEEIGITKSPALYQSALAVLAIHPDYILRNGILKAMNVSWATTTQEGEQYVLLGMLRDGQYELAFEKLEQMAEQNAKIAPWVYDIFIFAFCQLRFLDEAIKIVHQKLRDPTADIPMNLWYHLLDVCSSAYHYEGTKYLWRRLVNLKKVNPTDGMVLNVLNIAARYHDTTLATSAVQVLTERGTKLHPHHFEALIECYAGRKEVDKALQVLCVMTKAGMRPTMGSTRPIYQCLKRNPQLLNAAVDTLLYLRREYEVPIGAVDVLIEATVETGTLDAALDIYRYIRGLCSEGPGLKTMYLLLKDFTRLDIARFLAEEHPALALKANQSVYEIVIHDCAISGRLDTAFKLVSEIPIGEPGEDGVLSDSWWIDQKTVLALAKQALAVEDSRVWAVIDEAKRRNMPIDAALQEISQGLRPNRLGQAESPVVEQRAKREHLQETVSI